MYPKVSKVALKSLALGVSTTFLPTSGTSSTRVGDELFEDPPAAFNLSEAAEDAYLLG